VCVRVCPLLPPKHGVLMQPVRSRAVGYLGTPSYLYTLVANAQLRVIYFKVAGSLFVLHFNVVCGSRCVLHSDAHDAETSVAPRRFINRLIS